jgi:hypothetical protein
MRDNVIVLSCLVSKRNLCLDSRICNPRPYLLTDNCSYSVSSWSLVRNISNLPDFERKLSIVFEHLQTSRVGDRIYGLETRD